MFKHLLLPTDGAQLSETAIVNGIQIAKDLSARVTGFHVLPDFRLFTSRAEMLIETKAEFTRDARARAAQYLDVIERLANMAGVRGDTRCCSGAHPYEAIIRAAEGNGCDLIVMGSHGRKGVHAQLLGSEVQEVLTHTQIPALVYRRAPRSPHPPAASALVRPPVEVPRPKI